VQKRQAAQRYVGHVRVAAWRRQHVGVGRRYLGLSIGLGGERKDSSHVVHRLGKITQSARVEGAPDKVEVLELGGGERRRARLERCVGVGGLSDYSPSISRWAAN
jgi:hypothetical protein